LERRKKGGGEDEIEKEEKESWTKRRDKRGNC